MTDDGCVSEVALEADLGHLGSVWGVLGVRLESVWRSESNLNLRHPRDIYLTPHGPILEPLLDRMLAPCWLKAALCWKPWGVMGP